MDVKYQRKCEYLERLWKRFWIGIVDKRIKI